MKDEIIKRIREFETTIYSSFNCSSDDLVEYTVYDSGRIGVLYYPQQKPTSENFNLFFTAIDLADSSKATFSILLKHIPVENYAIRIVPEQGLSIFFKSDFNTDTIHTLASNFLQPESAEKVLGFFKAMEKEACGFALEETAVNNRIRFYLMIFSMEDLEKVLRQLLLLGYTPLEVDAIKKDFQDYFQTYVVLNLGIKNNTVSIKLEFPEIQLHQVHDTIENKNGQMTKQELVTVLSPGEDTLSFLGIRYIPKKRREFTYYLKHPKYRGVVQSI